MARLAAGILALSLGMTLTAAAATAPGLTAAQIIDKNAAARGGVAAWRKIRSMAWVGHVESAKVPGQNMPFLLEQKRPNSTRFEIVAQNQKSVRAYDGSSGWKLRPGGSGIPEAQTYTPDELNFARGAQAIDGPLMEDVAAGGDVTLGGIEEVDGHKAHVLKVRLPSGAQHRVWVDAETFLELKYEREFRNAQGRNAVTAMFYRDYHDFQGLQIPVVIESGSASGKDSSKMVIERVALNPPLDEQLFARPNLPVRRHRGVTVDTRGAAATGSDRVP
jgi:hypothetical protein